MAKVASIIALLFSVVMPQKMWYAPSQPINVTIKSDKAVKLDLTDFTGKSLEAKGSPNADPDAIVDISAIFPQVKSAGTYVLWARPADGGDIVGTPIVIESRIDKKVGNDVIITHLEPLRYGVMTTDKGAVTMAFYYDVAPNTVESFLTLADGGYFDGLTFHRIVPGFVIQGGDPTGTGQGGPGYEINQEFNNRPHEAGVLSMARTSDPNSAGSQFFVCLDYNQTKQLDGKYTTFGKVTDGMDAVNKIAATPLADQESGKPATPQVIKSIQILPVSATTNPYAALMPNLPKK
jgi:peptidyl-prolyl cis-trans isomerase B (cyclophilin B)